MLNEYQTEEDKSRHFIIAEKIVTQEQVDQLIESFSFYDGGIWRGICESKYQHYTSLQRYWIGHDLPKKAESVLQYIHHIVNYTRHWNGRCLEKLHRIRGQETISIYSALSMLRHHGSPTPILDWSVNPLISLYFAAASVKNYPIKAEIDNYFSLYYMPSDHAFLEKTVCGDKNSYEKMAANFREYRVVFDTFIKHARTIEEVETQAKKLEIFQKVTGSAEGFRDYMLSDENFFANAKKRAAWIITDAPGSFVQWSINNNYNIVNQEGLFIVNAHPNDPFEEILSSQGSDKLYCYEFHKSLQHYILNRLLDFGIHNDFIYPNLYRLAENSLTSYFELRESEVPEFFEPFSFNF
ncbi:MAG: FRG domain-containing protein [Bacteroidetes bacterium]|jgi:hypothetical protein|nr:MAG: FRG domain-containing protein [Bacteroidota bacterium]